MIKRNTAQKTTILSYMKSTKSHPTAEMVYNEVSKELPTISLSTVYRNLNSMVEEGTLLKIEVGNEAHYDADLSFHHHVYCKCCHRIYDLFDEELSEMIAKNMELPGFQIDRVMLLIQATCPECANAAGCCEASDDTKNCA